MADFFRGLAGGFQSGLQLGQAMRDKQQREELAQVYAKPDSYLDYTAAGQKQIQDLAASGLYNLEAVPGAEGVAPTLRYTPKQGLMSYDASGNGVTEAPIEIAPQQVQRYAGQVAEGQFDPTVLQGLRAREAARVLGAYGDPVRAAQLEQQAGDLEYQAKIRPMQLEQLRQQGALTGIQLADAQKKQSKQNAYDTGLEELNKQTFEKPEDRTTAILDLVERTQGPEARQQLQSSYTQTELNGITLQAKKFEEGYRQSRAKGVVSALEWFDEQNTSFKLERDPKNPFRYIQVNSDGTRSVFADAKNEKELGMMLDAKAKPGGWLELSKYELDVKKADDLAKYYANVGGARGVTNLKQQVADFKAVFGRDPTEEEKGIMAKLINKESNRPEFTPKDYAATIKSFTDAGFSQTDAVIRADQLYGRGPNNEKVDAGLQAANKSKAAGTPSAPVEVRPGEARLIAPGAAVRGPLDDFLRESRRGLFGGVEYFYTDPVTKKRYTTEQYNQLLNK